MSMNISLLESERSKLSPASLKAVESNLKLIEDAGQEIRTMSHLLHPPLLDEVGLDSALRWYVDGYSERSQIQVDLEIPAAFRRLPDHTELAVFRIVQECLTNIHRHSGSSTATIRIQQDGSHLTVEVRDNGKGIPLQKQRELMDPSHGGGVGFGGIRERLRQLGGTLMIQSNGTGTVVTADLEVT